MILDFLYLKTLTAKNCNLLGALAVLKKQILNDLKNIPNSGTPKIISEAQSQVTRSSNGRIVKNCLSKAKIILDNC